LFPPINLARFIYKWRFCHIADKFIEKGGSKNEKRCSLYRVSAAISIGISLYCQYVRLNVDGIVISDKEAMEMINREHKDRLFCFLFGREENKEWTLSLYNAVSRSCHTDPDDIHITTMENVLYMGMKNDVSFIITNIMNIYEQQSTFNPNMPIRGLMYAARLYDKYIHDSELNIYGSELIPLPVPKLVTFYNGRTEKEDMYLELGDAFQAGKAGQGNRSGAAADAEPDIKVRVRMVNINYGHNQELMEACEPLGEYAWLVGQIRENDRAMEIDKAVDKAIDDMPEGFKIKKFLVGNRAEVKQMCITEYNEAETMEMFKKEGHREGRKEGRKEGVQLSADIMKCINNGMVLDEEIAKACNCSVEDVGNVRKAFGA